MPPPPSQNILIGLAPSLALVNMLMKSNVCFVVVVVVVGFLGGRGNWSLLPP